MHRRTLVALVGVALTASAAGGISAVAQDPGSSPPEQTAPADFTAELRLRERDFRVYPVGRSRNFEPGSRFSITGRLSGGRSGRVMALATAVPGDRSLIEGVIALPDGDITFAGLDDEEKVRRFAVTGGTGAYAGARGVVTDTDMSEARGVQISRTVVDFR